MDVDGLDRDFLSPFPRQRWSVSTCIVNVRNSLTARLSLLSC
jgi:hypothetical protein